MVINKCFVIFKALQRNIPEYLTDNIIKLTDVSAGTSRFAGWTIHCRRYTREVNGFLVASRKRSSSKTFRKGYLNFLN